MGSQPTCGETPTFYMSLLRSSYSRRQRDTLQLHQLSNMSITDFSASLHVEHFAY